MTSRPVTGDDDSRRVVAAARPATEDDLPAAYRVRHVVFVDEQQVSVELERDEHDESADHVVVELDGGVVATGRLVVEPGGVAHLGRLAVLAPYRRRGLGAALVAALEGRARRRGLAECVLGAQVHAIPFYERLGYVVEGPEFDDAGIPHRTMRKRLVGPPR